MIIGLHLAAYWYILSDSALYIITYSAGWLACLRIVCWLGRCLACWVAGLACLHAYSCLLTCLRACLLAGWPGCLAYLLARLLAGMVACSLACLGCWLVGLLYLLRAESWWLRYLYMWLWIFQIRWASSTSSNHQSTNPSLFKLHAGPEQIENVRTNPKRKLYEIYKKLTRLFGGVRSYHLAK